jgi:hypothetical protein
LPRGQPKAAAGLVDSPFADAEEMIGGFFLLSRATHDEALALAAECPAAERATVETCAVGPCHA